jgi:hypothetical protein
MLSDENRRAPRYSQRLTGCESQRAWAPTNTYPTNLDSNGGHVGVTAEYPSGIYHYHCSTVNYMNGGYYVIKSGAYHGTKGTFTF